MKKQAEAEEARLEQERLEKEKLEAERIEQEKLAAEAKRQGEETGRLEQERLEKEKLEAKAKAQAEEAARIEKERLATEEAARQEELKKKEEAEATQAKPNASETKAQRKKRVKQEKREAKQRAGEAVSPASQIEEAESPAPQVEAPASATSEEQPAPQGIPQNMQTSAMFGAAASNLAGTRLMDSQVVKEWFDSLKSMYQSFKGREDVPKEQKEEVLKMFNIQLSFALRQKPKFLSEIKQAVDNMKLFLDPEQIVKSIKEWTEERAASSPPSQESHSRDIVSKELQDLSELTLSVSFWGSSNEAGEEPEVQWEEGKEAASAASEEQPAPQPNIDIPQNMQTSTMLEVATSKLGGDSFADRQVVKELIDSLNRVYQSFKGRQDLPEEEKEEVLKIFKVQLSFALRQKPKFLSEIKQAVERMKLLLDPEQIVEMTKEWENERASFSPASQESHSRDFVSTRLQELEDLTLSGFGSPNTDEDKGDEDADQ